VENMLACPDTTLELECNTEPCPVDCVAGEWSEWSQCSQLCGEGHERRQRKVTPPVGNGTACPGWADVRVCDTKKPCEPACSYGPWRPGVCSKECGVGMAQYIRTLLAGSPDVCNAVVEVRPCNLEPCDVPCVVGEWEGSDCDAPCGGGSMVMTRKVTTAPSGRSVCPTLRKVEVCNTQPCAVRCDYGQWTTAEACSHPCGGGTRPRRREVTCLGCNSTHTAEVMCESATSVEVCAAAPCPTDCEYSAWGEWSPCDAPCGDGKRSRTRTITRQPEHGGAPCVEPLYESTGCRVSDCDPRCKWSEWQVSTECSVTCGGGVMTSTRALLTTGLPASWDAALDCPGPTTREEACNQEACTMDCEVSAFAKSSPCSAPCGGGVER